MDYSNMLNLPKTDFPMRANLPQREPEYLKKWEEDKIYERLIERDKNNKKFVLHDGPPYANGDIHLGTALNKILKDIVVKYYSMKGYYSPYVPGWDTHGLPTEQRAIKELNLRREEVGPVVFRNACRDFALKYLDRQRESFKRLGVRGDWDNPYVTLTKDFEARQIKVFGTMATKGYIYKGLRPVYWCPDCETALAEAEIEYQEDSTSSIFVKFKVSDDKGKLVPFTGNLDKTYIVIWTTTAWTLPGNLAISLNPDFVYSVVKANGEYYVLAKELVKDVMETCEIEEYELVGEIKGEELDLVECQHPFLDRKSIVVLGDHVTLEAGTGCVHTAPGFGHEDFEVCKKYSIETIVPVDEKGMQTEEAGPFAGMFYEKSNKYIIEHLRENGHLLKETKITHQYPHCWRCKDPIIFRATEQWFVSIDAFRNDALEAIKGVRWIPGWGEERISKMVQDRSDWCISRQRIWGVPIPIFYCKKCGKELINEDTIENISRIFNEKGSNSWFELSEKELMGKEYVCECGGAEWEKETDIMDVWFDSGSTHYAVVDNRPELGGTPVEMYLEGSDQHRGWFQSSLLTSVAMGKGAPYKEVLTHGYVVDGQGKKMSKSLGNVIEPHTVIKKYGADILRLWVASSDYKVDIRVSEDIFKQLSEVYRKIRNTARFILGNINDFDPNKDMVAYEDMIEIDRWALLKLYNLLQKVNESFDEYEFHALFHQIHNFCVVDMSNFYLDIIKDRLYTSRPESSQRRSAQSAMFIILDTLVRILTPVLAFTSEEIWQHMPHKEGDETLSVQLNYWPELDEKYKDKELEEKWDKLIDIKYDVAKVLELARNEKKIGHSLDAKVVIFADGEDYEFIKANEELLNTVCITSAFEVCKLDEAPENSSVSEYFENIRLLVEDAPGEKCERCWMYSETVGTVEEHPSICTRCYNNIK
ncbi:MAG: isoleucine--tRNA ligase [Clostridiaceae bacterium]|nr:isoleucine--tRNA ligase [Clostridiaceae bacterium]